MALVIFWLRWLIELMSSGVGFGLFFREFLVLMSAAIVVEKFLR